MNPKKIKHFIFDLGNVLVDIHPEKTLQEFATICSIDYEPMKTFFQSSLHLNFMAGEYSPEEFYQKMLTKFSCHLTLTEFISIWDKVIGGPKEGIPSLIKRLKKDYFLSVCSNTDIWHWQSALEKAPFLRLFDEYFLSFQMKMNKPDPQLFKKLLSDLNASGEECIFFDDTEENIIQAKNFGINSLCTDSVEEMTKFITTLGLPEDA